MINVEWFSMILGKCPFCHKKFIKRRRKTKFCSLICSNNFNKNGLKQIKLPPYSQLLAEFVGICLGDGCVSKYQTGITLNAVADKNYIPYVSRIIYLLFSNIKIAMIKKEDAVEIKISSRVISDFLHNMGIIPNNKSVPDWIFKSKEYRNHCVRGLFDTEGSISFKTYASKKGISLYKQLNFRNANKKLMRFVRDTLKDMGLKPTMSLKKSLYLSNHEDIDYFNKTVGFGNPKIMQRANIRTIGEYYIWSKVNSNEKF